MLKGEEKIYHADINQKKRAGAVFVLPIYRLILRINRIAHKYWALVSKSATHRHMEVLYMDAGVAQVGE